MAHTHKVPSLHELSDQIHEMKDKITSGEFLKIMNTMGKLYKEVVELQDGVVGGVDAGGVDAGGVDAGGGVVGDGVAESEEMNVLWDAIFYQGAEGNEIIPNIEIVSEDEDDEDDDDDDDDEDDEIVITSDLKVSIGGKNYYKVSALGLNNVLLNYPEADEAVGILNEDGVTIDPIE